VITQHQTYEDVCVLRNYLHACRYEGELSAMSIKRRVAGSAVFGTLLLSVACQNLAYRLNEDVALDTIKSIRSAEQAYRTTRGLDHYASLQELADQGLLKPKMSTSHHGGYFFNVELVPGGYRAVAWPEQYGANAYSGTGGVSFFVDQTGVIRRRYDGKKASQDDEPLGKQ
jgi:hypothetical protein